MRKPKGFDNLCAVLADLDPDEIYEAGKAEGRRLERMRAQKLRKKTGVCGSCGRLDQLDKAKVAETLRTKPAKRKEGR